MANLTKELRFTAKTLESALAGAASKFQVDLANIEHRVVSQTSGGFFSFLGKKIEIAAWVKSGRSKESAPAASADEEIDVEELVEDLRLFCRDICQIVSGSQAEVAATLESNRLILDVDDEFLGGQMAKNGKLAESLEHILRKKPRHLKRELPFRIFVDVKGTRRKRETDLIELAKDLSEKVSENRRPIVLNYKSSYDRKIIHMALDKDQRVYTKSVGTGPNRKLMILPIKKKEKGSSGEVEVQEV